MAQRREGLLVVRKAEHFWKVHVVIHSGNPRLRELKWEGCEFEDSLDFIEGSCPK